eukprot:1856941-Rhodomonas_salina.1
MWWGEYSRGAAARETCTPYPLLAPYPAVSTSRLGQYGGRQVAAYATFGTNRQGQYGFFVCFGWVQGI